MALFDKRRYFSVMRCCLLLSLLAACSPAQIPHPTPTPAPVTLAPTTQVPPTSTPLPTVTPVPTATPEPTEMPEPSATATLAFSSPTMAETMASLQDLSIDAFFETSHRQLRLRDPEGLTGDGLSEVYGLRDDQLTNLSDAYIRETQALEAAILDLLRTYDRDALTPEQQLSYDVYEWTLDNLVQGHAFMYHNYPVHHFLNSYHDNLIRLFTEIHPLVTQQNAEDYVARLSQVNDQAEQVLEGLTIREELGVVPPKYILEMAIGQMLDYLHVSSPDPTKVKGASLSVYTVFAEKLDAMEDLDSEDRQAMLDAALTNIETAFIPAYIKLLEYLEKLTTVATDDAGVWKFPDGDAYYAYRLRDQTSTDLTPQEIHELGLAEVTRIQAEMRQAFNALGYPKEASLRELVKRAADEGGYYDIRSQDGKAQLVAAYETILDDVDQKLDTVFSIRPPTDVAVVGGPIGGYYVSGTRDGSRPGAFHVSTSGSWVAKYRMPSLTYHETVPGHHLQIATAQSLNLPGFRNDVFFNGYAEGWAVYAERLAWEMGLYDDDPYGNIGRLDYELLRAVRLVVDTGIHAMRWTREEARAYMLDVFGSAYEVDRYIVMPAQATGYKIGMLKILELRQQAMEALGDRFDLKAFHNVMLTNGSVPLEILERLGRKYIDDTLASAPAEDSYTPVYEASYCRFPIPQGYEIECGDLFVPESHSQPNGATIRLHVGIFKSTNPNPAPDPVIHLMGGPGASPLDVVEGVLYAGGNAILKQRDYIMFSQRGTHYAEPFLGCPGRVDFQWELAAQSLSLAERNARELEFWSNCHDSLVAQGVNLAAYNSAENAADVDDLRLALGYEQVNLYGISYGSRLALTVLRDHPEGIRSATIDAIWPPQVALDHDVALNAYGSFRALFDACAADTYCSKTYPDLEATFRQVLQDLTVHPVTFQFDRGPVTLNGETFLGALFSLLHSIDAIPWIPVLITDAARGQYDEGLFEIGGAGTYAWAMHYAVRCYEEFAFESQEEALALVADLPPEFRDFFVDTFEYALCDAWGIGTDDLRENEPIASNVPTLIFSGRYDPITPPTYGRLTAETLSNGYFIEFPTLSHGVMRSNECALDIGLAFLDNPTAKPDTSCMEDLTGPEFKP
ncbi:MAG: DUF885 family protein [Anaerolineae bacterium]|nr:DUF885 family protein [Anaerolineae bacterium]